MPPFLIALISITLIGLWLVLAVLADGELRPPKEWRRSLRQLPHAATWAVLVFALVCGGLALWLGWIGFSEQTKEELYVNLATSLGSIAITVLVIDQLNRWRMAAERKREIIEQMGSPVNDAALEAVRLARKYGWLTDGSLRGADLRRANLAGVDLRRADLSAARLWLANLIGARLWEVSFVDASLVDANLTGADLSGASLDGTDLRRANLTDAKLSGAQYDERTVWPDGFDFLESVTVFVEPDSVGNRSIIGE